MILKNNASLLLLIFLLINFQQPSQACSMYKLTADGKTITPMDIRHGEGMFHNARQGCDVRYLNQALVLNHILD